MYTTGLMWQLIPSLQQCFPMDRGEKHLGGLLISLWFPTAIVETAPNCYLLPHQPLLLRYIICITIEPPLFLLRLMLWPLVQYHGGMCLVLARRSRVELGNGRTRNTLCDCVSSASQLSGQGSLLLAERKQESEWKRQAQSWGCFFSYSQSTSPSSCCNPAIKIVFHSAFSLYITKATTDFFLSLSLKCWQFSWTKKLHTDR